MRSFFVILLHVFDWFCTHNAIYRNRQHQFIPSIMHVLVLYTQIWWFLFFGCVASSWSINTNKSTFQKQWFQSENLHFPRSNTAHTHNITSMLKITEVQLLFSHYLTHSIFVVLFLRTQYFLYYFVQFNIFTTIFCVTMSKNVDRNIYIIMWYWNFSICEKRDLNRNHIHHDYHV